MLEVSNSGSRFNRSSIVGETETSRLQRDIERFTKLLEKERRKSMLIDEELKKAKEKLRDIKDHSQQGLLHPNEQARLERSVPRLESKLQSDNKKLNTIQSSNRIQRELINKSRRVKSHLQKSWSQINLANDRSQNMRRNASMQSLSTNKRSKSVQRKAELIRSQSFANKSTSRARISNLRGYIHDDRVTKTAQIKNIESSITQHLLAPGDACLPIMVLRPLAERWEPKVAEKKAELEEYLNHIKLIKEGFQEISQATGMFGGIGLQSVDAIVKSLLKSQEQTTALQKHINILVDQIDELECEINAIDKRQEDADIFKQDENHYKETRLNETSITLERAKEQYFIQLNHLNRIQEDVRGISKPLSDLISELQGSHLQISITEKEQEPDTTTSAASIMSKIAKLEEYLNALSVYDAYKHDERLAAAKPVPYRELPSKEFDSKALSIKNVLETNQLLDDPTLELFKVPIKKDVFSNMADSLVQRVSNDDLPVFFLSKAHQPKEVISYLTTGKTIATPPTGKRSRSISKTHI